MWGPGLRWATAVALSSADLVVESGRIVAGDDAFDVRPRQFRRLLLTFESSVQGRISAILGEDEEERIDTLVRLLRGTDEEELSELAGYFAAALERLQRDRAPGPEPARRSPPRRRARGRRAKAGGASLLADAPKWEDARPL